jgi:ELWxxDGT repeat protein
VADVLAGPGSSAPADLTAAGGLLFFTATTPPFGRELWRTDGTTAGTVLVADLLPGPDDSTPGWLTAAGGVLYFAARHPAAGLELHRSDGTAAGTALVRDLWPGPYGSGPAELIAWRGQLLFTADDGASGVEPWVTDGTAGGTQLLREIAFGPVSSDPGGLVATTDAVLFAADDGVHGRELWRTDGTTGGTWLLADLEPGPLGSAPAGIAPAGRRRAFLSAHTQARGRELWRTDGTTAGTSLAADVRSGPDGGDPGPPVLSRGTLLFAADDGVHGRELHRHFPGATAQPVGQGCGGALPTLAATDPVLGGVAALWGERAPPGTLGFVALGVWGPAFVLPVSPCVLHVGPASIVVGVVPPSAGSWSLPLPIPALAALQGVVLRLQGGFGPTANAPLWCDLTNGLFATIGT